MGFYIPPTEYSASVPHGFRTHPLRLTYSIVLPLVTLVFVQYAYYSYVYQEGPAQLDFITECPMSLQLSNAGRIPVGHHLISSQVCSYDII